MATMTQTDTEFLNQVQSDFANSNKDFARSYYLFATARLEKTYDSAAIYDRYPLLQEEATFQRLKTLYDTQPDNEEIKRMFVSALGTYIGNKLVKAADELTNLKDGLKIDLSGLAITDKNGKVLSEILYEDTPELFKRLSEKSQRDALYERVSTAYNTVITPKFIDLFHQENQLLADLGYPDIVGFYSQSSGHNLKKLGQKGAELVKQTQAEYDPVISAYYKQRTGLDFSQATRADIAYVFSGKDPEMAQIDARFPESALMTMAQKTFDELGLDFSNLAEQVAFENRETYDALVDSPERPTRILLDMAAREGKRSRAYVYPAQAPQEVYLSVKPEGGLSDFSAFFHESGHALHFAYAHPELSFAMALMGNNTVTESYAYLFQNLFLNAHWLVNVGGLSEEQAYFAIRRTALNDLYMLRRYASKMQFELALYDKSPLDEKPALYSQLLTKGTGFSYDAESWSRDVDAGFYVADYFTAWTLEAQLREVLLSQFGSYTTQGEDWYQNPEAGKYLRELWADGNLTQIDLSERLGYNDPTDTGPLLRLMTQNLSRQANL